MNGKLQPHFPEEHPHGRVFRWRGLDGTPIPKLIATAIVLCLFGAFLATVRVRIIPPLHGVERKASVIYLPADGEGRAWAMRAIEEGPFPSRFEPTAWEGLSHLPDPATPGSVRETTGYEPSLVSLPEVNPPRLQLAPKGERMLPARSSIRDHTPETVSRPQVPALYPLTAIPPESMPAELPDFPGDVDAAMAATPWRFLLRLHPDGGVADCVSLTGANGPATAALENWLRGVKFPPETAAALPWVALAVTFTNQTAADGPDAR